MNYQVKYPGQGTTISVSPYTTNTCTINYTGTNTTNTYTTTASPSYYTPISIDLKDITNMDYISYYDLPSDSYKIKIKEKDLPKITKVEVLNPNKVIRFTFDNKQTIKTICLDSDNFNFEFSFFLAYSKLLYSKLLTIEGIEKKAIEMQYQKKFITLVKEGIKVYKADLKKQEKEKEEKEKLKEQRRIENEKRRIKNQKKREARINEIAEAIKRASE